MSSASLSSSKILSPEFNRYLNFEEKLLDLEIKLNSLINAEDVSTRKFNIRKYIDNYTYEMRMREREKKDKEVFKELVRKVEGSKEKLKYEEYIQNKIIINRSIKLDEIRSHDAKFKEIKRRLATEREVEKMKINEAIKNTNEQLSISVEYTKKQLKKNEINQKEEEEKERMDSVLKQFNKKEFSKMVQQYYKPDIKKLRRNEDDSFNDRHPVHMRKNKSVILKKMTNKNKYKWELKLDKSSDIDYSQIYSSSPKRKEPVFSPVIIKTPLKKKPDYLTNARISREQQMKIKDSSFSLENSEKKWEKMLNIEESSILHNIEEVKIQAEILESKAKMNEVLIKNCGGVKDNPEAIQKITDLYADSIKAKLAILNKINNIK